MPGQGEISLAWAKEGSKKVWAILRRGTLENRKQHPWPKKSKKPRMTFPHSKKKGGGWKKGFWRNEKKIQNWGWEKFLQKNKANAKKDPRLNCTNSKNEKKMHGGSPVNENPPGAWGFADFKAKNARGGGASRGVGDSCAHKRDEKKCGEVWGRGWKTGASGDGVWRGRGVPFQKKEKGLAKSQIQTKKENRTGEPAQTKNYMCSWRQRELGGEKKNTQCGGKKSLPWVRCKARENNKWGGFSDSTRKWAGEGRSGKKWYSQTSLKTRGVKRMGVREESYWRTKPCKTLREKQKKSNDWGGGQQKYTSRVRENEQKKKKRCWEPKKAGTITRSSTLTGYLRRGQGGQKKRGITGELCQNETVNKKKENRNGDRHSNRRQEGLGEVENPKSERNVIQAQPKRDGNVNQNKGLGQDWH